MASLCRDCLWYAASSGSPASCPSCGGARIVSHAALGELTVAHIDCDAFYASVEKRDRPELAELPVLIGGTSRRGVVLTACYVARRFGPRSAMPMFKAQELCPQAIVIRPDFEKYKAASRTIRHLMHLLTPLVEPLSLDEAYLDLGPEVRRDPRPPALLLAGVAREVERRVGITVSIGLAPNKLLAKLASDMNKPRGFTAIDLVDAPRMLAPLPVRHMRGVGPATAARLEAAGFDTVADIQALTVQQLTERLGRMGEWLHRQAFGRDGRSVSIDHERKSLSAETTFDRDLSRLADLEAELAPLAATVSRRLQAADVAAGSIVLKLKTTDFQLRTRHAMLATPTARADRLLEAARHLLQREATGPRFRLIGLGSDRLVPLAEADPPDLFGAAC